jgi:hypothetical protein
MKTMKKYIIGISATLILVLTLSTTTFAYSGYNSYSNNWRMPMMGDMSDSDWFDMINNNNQSDYNRSNNQSDYNRSSYNRGSYNRGNNNRGNYGMMRDHWGCW